MWLLRGVGKNRWLERRAYDPAHVAAAAKDLCLRPGEDGLSLFRADDEEDGRRVATLLGVSKVRARGRSDAAALRSRTHEPWHAWRVVYRGPPTFAMSACVTAPNAAPTSSSICARSRSG